MQRLPFKTVYKCTLGRSTDYVRLASQHDVLTLDRNYIVHRFGKTNRTAFREIHLAGFDSVLSIPYRRLMNVRRQVQESQQELFTRIKAALKAIIMDKWTPGGYHAVLHSSGLDSRCVSWLIRELAQEHGKDWLGTVAFCCSKWEGNVFKGIMKYQGWDRYIVAYEDQSNHDYYASSLTDFRGAWEWSDGAINIAVNLFWYPVVAAIEAGLLPDDQPIQTWTGQWGNTILDAGSSTQGPKVIHQTNSAFYNSILCKRPMYGVEIVHPYAFVELAKVICESSVVLGKKLRPLFCKYLDPKLAAFTNLAADGDRHRRIADWILAQMKHDYAASWYGQKVKPNAKPKHRTTEFQDFWYHWTLASFCEELRRRGIEIK